MFPVAVSKIQGVRGKSDNLILYTTLDFPASRMSASQIFG